MIRAGGYLGIIGGGFIAFGGIAYLVIAPQVASGVYLESELVRGSVILIVGILGILCGIRALQVNKWKWAISGYILISLVAAWFVYVNIIVNLIAFFQYL
jgi:hypothetical protein